MENTKLQSKMFKPAFRTFLTGASIVYTVAFVYIISTHNSLGLMLISFAAAATMALVYSINRF